MNKLLFLDIETTGLDEKDSEGMTLVAQEVHSIIELSGIVDIDGKIVDKFELFAAPKKNDIPNPAILEMQNLTMDKLLQRPSQKQLYTDFLSLLAKHVDKFNKGDKFWVVGYNIIPFDIPFLRQLFIENEDKYFGSWFWIPPIDVMPLVGASLIRTETRAAMKNFKLSTVAETFGISADESKYHNALYDCRVTRQIFYKLMES